MAAKKACKHTYVYAQYKHWSLVLAPIMHYSVYVHDGELSVSDI